MLCLGFGVNWVGCNATLRPSSGSAVGPISAEGGSAGSLLLVLTDDDYPTQRLFRLRFDGPEGGGSGRLTMRLESPQRFEIAVADAFGRAIWTLGADESRGLLVDHRQRTVCPLDSGVALARFLPSPVPLRALPALLLGRLPVSGETTSSEDGSFRLVDESEREWVVRKATDGTVAAWTLWIDGRPTAWWQRLETGEALLSERIEGVQLRWRQTVSEAMRDPLAALEPPADYQPADCSSLDLRMASPEPTNPS